jgi:hypothetical protein
MNRSRRTLLRLALFPAAVLLGETLRAAERVFALPLRNGRLPKELQLLRVTEGDIVTLRWTADRAVVLHLHGYDIEKHIEAGVASDMTFTARATGRFPVHAHMVGAKSDDAPLLYVEVYPR